MPFALHEYQSLGVYLATLTVTDNEGKATTSAPQVIVATSINEAPTADFDCTLARIIFRVMPKEVSITME